MNTANLVFLDESGANTKLSFAQYNDAAIPCLNPQAFVQVFHPVAIFDLSV